MAKTKHQKLADLMSQMLKEIEKHFDKTALFLNAVQLHFSEQYVLLGRPLMTETALQSMFKSHYLGLQHFAQNPALREKCQELPFFAAAKNRPFLLSEYRVSSGNGIWVIPWKVKIRLPEQNEANYEKGCQEALLYCPDKSELTYHIDWFEKEDASNSLTHIFLSIGAYYQEQDILKNNLLGDPAPIYQESINDWKADPDSSDIIADNVENLDIINFAPQLHDSIAIAYERVMKSIRSRDSRHRQNLRKKYKEKLEQSFFKWLNWTEEEKTGFIQKWESNLFPKNKKKHNSKSDRWEHCQSIDRFKAAKIIRHFIDKFVQNPKEKKYGEIACILWLLLWFAQEGDSNKITVSAILNLSSKEVANDDQTIKIGDSEVEVSSGLHQLLFCLRGQGTGKRERRLFANVANLKSLERALHQASKEILGTKELPVQPAAFLLSPHLFPGIQISAKERELSKNARQLIPFQNTRHQIKAALMKAQRR